LVTARSRPPCKGYDWAFGGYILGIVWGKVVGETKGAYNSIKSVGRKLTNTGRMKFKKLTSRTNFATGIVQYLEEYGLDFVVISKPIKIKIYMNQKKEKRKATV